MSKVDVFKASTVRCAEHFGWVGIVALIVLLGTAVVDILEATFFPWPIPGSVDIIGPLGGITASFAIAMTEVLGQHARISFLTTRFPGRAQAVFGSVSSFINLYRLSVFCDSYLSLLAVRWQSAN